MDTRSTDQPNRTPRCRSCTAPLTRLFVDLGATPLANSLLTPDQVNESEIHIPLRAVVCDACFLVQLEDYVLPAVIFHDDYVYFSSFSDTWLEHAQRYVAQIVEDRQLDRRSFVVEIGSNDGYLLKNFVARDIPCLGVEPSANVAAAAEAHGVRTHCAFFGKGSADEIVRLHGPADLVVVNNVLAHVPDLNDFLAGLKVLLAEGGVVTVEAPHFLKLLQDVQFDTIYHEHFSYLSLISVENGVARHKLEVCDVEQLPTHGGSLRYYIRHQGRGAPSARVSQIKREEEAAGLSRPERYGGFQEQVRAIKFALLHFLLDARTRGKTVACYGAAAKGNTLLNYCGVDRDLIPFCVDRNPHKQGRLLPGSRIPVVSLDAVAERKPDYLLILPWNIKDEVIEKMAGIAEWGGKFVWAIPRLVITP